MASITSLFDPRAFIDNAIEQVRTQVGDRRAVIAASGGVDSTVAAAIVARAIGDQLVAVYVDTGLMRHNETEDGRRMLEPLGMELRVVEAEAEYLDALKGVTEPEEKRRIIGHKFIEIFDRHASETNAHVLVQGTIAPDWIESGGGARDTIKSHHNVGGLPEDMELELCEPLRDLYKDEVRVLAEHLGLAVAQRQPFPGPGLAVRCLGECTAERVAIVRKACHIVETEIDRAVAAGEMERPWQYYAALLPVRSVGVQGDLRAYGESVVVRAVQSFDAMTAEFSRIPYDVLSTISRQITNTMKDLVNRVVYDVTDKPPGTVEWE